MDKEKQNILNKSDFFSDLKIDKKKKKSVPDPFVDVVENGTYKELLSFIAENPNVSEGAIERIIEKYPLNSQEHWELRDKLTNNLNLPNNEKIKNELEKAYENEDKDFYEVRKTALERYSDVKLDSKDKREDTENITYTTHNKEAILLLGDPNTPETTKKEIKERIKSGNDERLNQLKEKREQSKATNTIIQESDTKRRKLLKDAKKGKFDSKEIEKAIHGITGGYTQIKTKDKDPLSIDYDKTIANRQKLLNLKQVEELKQAKTGKFSKDSLRTARQLLGIKKTDKEEIAGELSVSNKKLNTDQKTVKQNYEKMLSLKRQDEIKRAKRGDFSGIDFSPQEFTLKEDQKHYKQLETLKRQSEIRKAKSGDFSGIDLDPTKFTSKEDQKHHKQLETLKRQSEIRKDKENTKDIKKIKFNNSKIQLDRPTYFEDQDLVKIGSQEQQSVIDSFLYGSNNETEKSDINFSMDAFYTSLNETKKSLAELSTHGATSKNSERSAAAMNKMKSVQESVQQNDIKLKSGIAKNTKQNEKEFTPMSTVHNIPQTKLQPNSNKIVVQKDLASMINEKYKEYPEYKQMYG